MLKTHRIGNKLSVRDVDQHDLTYHSVLHAHPRYFPYECKPRKISLVAQKCTLRYLYLLPHCLSLNANSYNVIQRHSLGCLRQWNGIHQVTIMPKYLHIDSLLHQFCSIIQTHLWRFSEARWRKTRDSPCYNCTCQLKAGIRLTKFRVTNEWVRELKHSSFGWEWQKRQRDGKKSRDEEVVYTFERRNRIYQRKGQGKLEDTLWAIRNTV